jgi:hypothetical protein
MAMTGQKALDTVLDALDDVADAIEAEGDFWATQPIQDVGEALRGVALRIKNVVTQVKADLPVPNPGNLPNLPDKP